MTPFISSLAFGVGVAGWVYTKVGNRLGYADQKQIYLTAAGAGAAAFIVFYTVLHYMFSM